VKLRLVGNSRILRLPNMNATTTRNIETTQDSEGTYYLVPTVSTLTAGHSKLERPWESNPVTSLRQTRRHTRRFAGAAYTRLPHPTLFYQG
jgi:hypothetical protein